MKKEPKKIEIREVVVEAVATDDGYYKSRIIRTGEKFTYEGITKNGRFPLWLRPVGEPKFKDEVKPAKKAVKKEEEKPVEASISDLV